MELAQVTRSPTLSCFAAPVAGEARAQFFDAAGRLVAHDIGQRNGQLAQPQMDVRAADARDLDAIPALHRRRVHPDPDTPGSRRGFSNASSTAALTCFNAFSPVAQ